jgi:hypothetical protein
MDSTTVSLRTPINLVEKIDEEAANRRRSRNFIINELIEKHYSNGHKEPKPAARKSATKKATR